MVQKTGLVKLTNSDRSEINTLRKYAGTAYVIEFLSDLEVSRAASILKGALDDAQWKCVGFVHPGQVNVLPGKPVTDGVTILTERGVSQLDQLAPNELKLLFAAYELGDFLHVSNWQADVATDSALQLFPGIMKIRVGLKPNPFALTDKQKALAVKNRAHIRDKVRKAEAKFHL